MTSDHLTPGSSGDHRFAATLVVEGVLPEATVRAVLAKQQELLERERPLSVTAIVTRKGWVTATEAALLAQLDHPPADLLPGFRVGERVGYGGMSRVYRAVREGDPRPRALKILHPRLARDAGSRAQFEAEGRLLASLEHENLVSGYGVFEHDGLVVMEMDFVEGRSLLEILDDDGRFEEEAALWIVLQTARALTALHARGVVHRDIKPANILLDGDERVMLCDLGLAVGEDAEALEGMTAGTAEYVSPEQAVGEGGLDVRSDIYALGVTLYHLVVGKLPFEGDTSDEVMARRLLDELRSPELKGLGISPHLHYFVQKMMALDPAIRYQSPQDLIEDIEEQVSGREQLRGRSSGQGGAGGSKASPARPAPPAGGAVPRPRSGDAIQPRPRPGVRGRRRR